MTIKLRLLILIIFSVASIVTLYGLLRYSLSEAVLLKDTETKVWQLESDMLALRRYEKDFLSRFDLKYQQRFQDKLGQFEGNLAILKEELEHFGFSAEQVERINTAIHQYADHFNQVITISQQIGLNQEQGLRGELRSAVHAAESQVKALNDDRLLAEVLQLRRNEKDFLLRKDLKYRSKFESNFTQLLNSAEQRIFDSAQLQKTTTLLKQYQQGIHRLIDLQQQLGLNEKNGVLGQMRDAVHETEVLLEEEISFVTEKLQTTLQKMTLISSSIALVIAAISALITFYIARSIATPLTQLSKVMQQARDEKNLTLRASVEGKNEISQIGVNFNQMMTTFQTLLEEVKTATQTLNLTSGEVFNSSNLTKHGLIRQQSEVTEISSAVKQMEIAMQEISHNTDQTAQRAGSSRDNANEGNQVITDVINQISHLAEDTQQTSAAVIQLAEDSSKISTVLDVIKEIAEQINLLALNASIEAARAGDHGRGFSVVADEVRSLAARTQSSAAEIEEMIGGLQQQTQHVSGMMQQGADLSHECASRASDSLSALQNITQDAHEIVDMTAQAASAVEEQTAVAGVINQNAIRIQEIVTSASDQVQQNTVASSEVSHQADRLQNLVGQFKVE